MRLNDAAIHTQASFEGTVSSNCTIHQANQHVSEPEDLPTANATNPTHARRDLLRDDISGLTGEEGDSCKEVS